MVRMADLKGKVVLVADDTTRTAELHAKLTKKKTKRQGRFKYKAYTQKTILKTPIYKATVPWLRGIMSAAEFRKLLTDTCNHIHDKHPTESILLSQTGLMSVFKWKFTPQGESYWRELHYKVVSNKNKINLHKNMHTKDKEVALASIQK